MSGPDPTTIGSNWKILQQRLEAEKKAKGESNGVKRKRTKEKTATSAFKKRKFDFKSANGTALGKRRRMGSYMSTSTKGQDTRQEEKMPAADKAASTGKSQKRRSFSDDVNGGLHPTHKTGKYVALDCEMVGTGPPPHLDNVLARVSLVNFHGEQIYDSYVQPPPNIRIEDYRTYVSGIKPHHLRPGYARPFSEVQKDVAKLLEGRVLVGHALRNDMNALVLSHPKSDLRDTSRYPKFRIESKGKPPALRNLARSELGLEIQTGEHSSVEDARATMLLFQKEKQGFEEENRKRFGNRKPGGIKGKAAAVKEETADVEDDEDQEEEAEEDEDDLDLLSGEELEEALAREAAGGGGPKQMQAGKKKKTKKKKRTKRK